MIKILLFLPLLLFANQSKLDIAIKQSNLEIQKVLDNKKYAQNKLNYFGNLIKKYNNELKQINLKISKLNQKLFSQKKKYLEKKAEYNRYLSSFKELQKEQEKLENNLAKYTENFFITSLATNYIEITSIKDIYSNEVYKILLDEYQNNIINLNTKYLKVLQEKAIKDKELSKIQSYLKKIELKKKFLEKLKKQKEELISNINIQHKLYQKYLTKVLQRQKKLQDILVKLKMLKKVKIKEKNKKKKKKVVNKQVDEIQQTFNKQKDKFISDIKVKNIGSSTKGIKIVHYKGRKGIKPLKNFTIVKRFGKYFDKVYNIELFNDSILLRSKKQNAKVRAIFSGKIVYFKRDKGLLHNVVIIQHKNGLHTIYSNLSRIPKTIKKGKYIPQGYVIGRVKEKLQLQATKNSAYVDPEELF